MVLAWSQAIEAAIEAEVDDVEVVEGDDEGTTWVLTQPKDLMHLAGTASPLFLLASLCPASTSRCPAKIARDTKTAL